MEVSAIEPYTTKVMEGGIITPIAPEAAINAAEKEGEYPDLIMAGTRITPSAATVAGPDPEIAAKKQDTMTHTMAIPPFRCPTQVSASLISFSEIPAFSIIFPAKMKNGIASNTNLLVDADTIMGRLLITASNGRPAP